MLDMQSIHFLDESHTKENEEFILNIRLSPPEKYFFPTTTV